MGLVGLQGGAMNRQRCDFAATDSCTAHSGYSSKSGGGVVVGILDVGGGVVRLPDATGHLHSQRQL